jgi:hypothetical protein
MARKGVFSVLRARPTAIVMLTLMHAKFFNVEIAPLKRK